jgi:hypothetical protein
MAKILNIKDLALRGERWNSYCRTFYSQTTYGAGAFTAMSRVELTNNGLIALRIHKIVALGYARAATGQMIGGVDFFLFDMWGNFRLNGDIGLLAPAVGTAVPKSVKVAAGFNDYAGKPIDLYFDDLFGANSLMLECNSFHQTALGVAYDLYNVWTITGESLTGY